MISRIICLSAILYFISLINVDAQNLVTWQNKVGLSQTGNTLTKTVPTNQWGDAGAYSNESISAGTNGCLEYTIQSNNESIVIGLTEGNPDEDYVNIEYAFYLNSSGQLEIMESGVAHTTTWPYNAGDILVIQRIDNLIFYKQNGVLLKSTGTLIGKILNADLSIFTSGKKVDELILSTGNCIKCFVSLNPEPDGTFHKIHDGKLLFKYHEEYRNGTLNFTIYDDSHAAIIDETTLVQNKSKGMNWFIWDLNQYTGFVNNTYYLLEVSSEKGQIQFLRFYFTN